MTIEPDIEMLFWRNIAKMKNVSGARADALINDIMREKPVTKFTIGVIVRSGSAWIGAHWSPNRKRLCINLIPFVTIWFAFKGGMRP